MSNATPSPGAGAGHLPAVSSPQTAPAGRKARRRLSREEFERIAHDVIAQGGTWRAVADASGMTVEAVRIRGRRMGIAAVPAERSGRAQYWTEARIAELAEAVTIRGYKRVAQERDITTRGIYAALWRGGIGAAAIRARRAEIARRLAGEGMSMPAIGAVLHVTTRTVWAMLHEAPR